MAPQALRERVRAAVETVRPRRRRPHPYVDRSGDEVVVYVSEEEWPVAAGAEHDNSGETWLAEKGELVMICLDEPEPSLVVGDDVHDVERTAYALRP